MPDRIESGTGGELLGAQHVPMTSLASPSVFVRSEIPRLLQTSRAQDFCDGLETVNGFGVGVNPDFSQTYLRNADSMAFVTAKAETHLLLSGVEQAAPHAGYMNLDILGASSFGHVDQSDGREADDSPMLAFWRGARRELLEEMGVLVPYSWFHDAEVVRCFQTVEAPRPKMPDGRGSRSSQLGMFTVVVPENYTVVERMSTRHIVHVNDEGVGEEQCRIQLQPNREGLPYLSIEPL